MPTDRHLRPLAVFFALATLLSSVAPAWAHGDAPHPACKKGYVLTDDHKCVKAPA